MATVIYRCSIAVNQIKNENNETPKKMRPATKTTPNIHRHGLFDINCHIPDLVQDILRKNCELNLVLWLVKPPAYMTMLNSFILIKQLKEKNPSEINTINQTFFKHLC